MKISIIGTGYVGLVTGTCFSDIGNQVLCVDCDAKKITELQSGRVPIFEPGLEKMVKSNIEQDRLHFSTCMQAACDFADIIFIAVGTPPNEDGSADLRHVLSVADSIGECISRYSVIVTKSTVPVGTAKKVQQAIEEQLTKRQLDICFSVVSNPEFLKEGAAIEDFMKPDRIILGSEDAKATEIMRSLYAPFHRNHDRMIVMDVPSAELTKYAANAMLATKISFMNELSNVASLLDADIEYVRQGIGADPRIGYDFIYPGCGYGGSCFPKDVKALRNTAKSHNYATPLLDAVESVNQKQKEVLVNKVVGMFGEDLSGYTFAIWGLAFKPNTDDIREAPSLVIIQKLVELGATLQIYDPIIQEAAQILFVENEKVSVKQDMYSAACNADALLLITEWKMFRSPDFSVLKSKLKQAIIFDGRNIYDKEELAKKEFIYQGIGRKT